jgi:hypothetical protein
LGRGKLLLRRDGLYSGLRNALRDLRRAPCLKCRVAYQAVMIGGGLFHRLKTLNLIGQLPVLILSGFKRLQKPLNAIRVVRDVRETKTGEPIHKLGGRDRPTGCR